MTGAIGYRAYKIYVQERGKSGAVSFDNNNLTVKPLQFMADFVKGHLSPTQNTATERSWFFESKQTAKGTEKGLIHYGTFGFESTLVDPKTGVHQYKRKSTDVEEIPLYFEIWCPTKTDFALMAFQSFRGRSCILEVTNTMRAEYETKSPGYSLQFRKLMPSDSKGSLYSQFPVKRLHLIKKKAESNTVEKYLSNPPKVVRLEVIMSAERSGSLGVFSSIGSSLPKNAQGIVTYEGIEIDEAQADIRIGGQVRKVGVFGSDIEAGVIDLTESVTKGSDGHPTFDSMVAQSGLLLKEFAEILGVKP